MEANLLQNIILNERQKAILKAINENDFASIRELSETHEVSEATIRRDIDTLADVGLVGRVHGGAVKLASSSFERFHCEKMKIMTEEKQRIAKAAAMCVLDGDSIFLDSGSTTLFIANELVNKKNLTVVTDNLDIAYSIKFDTSSSVILTGGLCRRDYSAVVGSLAEDIIRNLKVDIAFVACDSVDSRAGVYNVNYLEIGVKKEIDKCIKKTILVTDHTKFNSHALAHICDLSCIDCIITDDGLSQKHVKALKEQKIELILC